ncbi:hypothetical protein PtA15_8A597 [Puccinia triticina]|nr:uncharacterized protein PtA15_8A597 [Puccinia triticina]WAQ87691.1 hypothetical protein PtA15_8A597 [Puccinia triticina]
MDDHPALPQHILLLHLSQHHLRQADELGPQLTARPAHATQAIGRLHYQPSGPATAADEDEQQLRGAGQAYRRHIALAVGCLQATASLPPDAVPAELRLAAHCQLARLLRTETVETARAAAALQHAQALARQAFPARLPLALTLAEALAHTQAADPRISFRQIKKQLERAIQLTLRGQTVAAELVPAYYRLQLQLCTLAYERAQDFPTALAALRSVVVLAEARGDDELWAACKTHELKMAIDRRQWALVGQLFAGLLPRIALPSPGEPSPPSTGPPPPPRIALGQQLTNYVLLLLVVYYAAVGLAEPAKAWLKLLRTAMDAPSREEGEVEGTYKPPMSSPVTPRKRTHDDAAADHAAPPLFLGTPPAQYVAVKIMPRELMYTLTYLVSLAVHFDGHGKSPKSLVYAQEGLKQVDRQLMRGFPSLAGGRSSGGYLASMADHLRLLMRIKTELTVLSVQLAIVRTDYLEADRLLVEVIKTTCEQGRWAAESGRVAFLKSMLSHATGNLGMARQSLLTSMHLAPAGGELGVLAKACYVLLRLAEPAEQRSEAVDRLIGELAPLAKTGLPAVAMAVHVVLALSCGEIVKAKHHLTSALNEANKTANTHLKMGLLGLLSTMFLNTRSDQATKMLTSCYKLSQGFAGGPPLQPVAGNVAAGSSLGLCVARKLVEIYEAQAAADAAAEGDGPSEELGLRTARLAAATTLQQRLLEQTPLL